MVSRAFRLVVGLTGFVSRLVAVVLLIGVAGLWLAARMPQTPWLARIEGLVATAMDGQQVRRLRIEADIFPEQRRLTGVAELTVEPSRTTNRLFLLLNSGLVPERIEAFETDGRPVAVRSLRIFSLLALAFDGLPSGSEPVRVRLVYSGQPTLPRSGEWGELGPNHVRLTPASLWYPTDGRGWFDVDATVHLPADLTPVQAGPSRGEDRGAREKTWRWQGSRPRAGLLLLADRRPIEVATNSGLRLVLDADGGVAPEAILPAWAPVESTLRTLLGSGGPSDFAVYVSPRLPHPVHDGSGLVALPLRTLRESDLGFRHLATELATAWWGGLPQPAVLPDPEGRRAASQALAKLTGHLAVEEHLGAEVAVWQRAQQGHQESARGTIKTSGFGGCPEGGERSILPTEADESPLALLLGASLSADSCRQTLLRVLEKSAGTGPTWNEVAAGFSPGEGESSLLRAPDDAGGRTIDIDLALSPVDASTVTVGNLGTTLAPGPFEVWRFASDGTLLEALTVSLGDSLSVASGETILLDPRFRWPDRRRLNHRFPTEEAPLALIMAPTGQRALVSGGALLSDRVLVQESGPGGSLLHSWDFPHGIAAPPRWDRTGNWMATAARVPGEGVPRVVRLGPGNERRTLGKGLDPEPDEDGSILAGLGESLLRLSAGKGPETMVRHSRGQIHLPRRSPDGRRIAYLLRDGVAAEVRVVGRDGTWDQRLLSLESDRTWIEWAGDSEHLYVVGGEGSGHTLWEIHVSDGTIRSLVRDAAQLADLVTAPRGRGVALVARDRAGRSGLPERDVFFLDPEARRVQRVSVPGVDLLTVAWDGGGEAQAVGVSLPRVGKSPTLPQRRLYRIDVAAGVASPIP